MRMILLPFNKKLLGLSNPVWIHLYPGKSDISHLSFTVMYRNIYEKSVGTTELHYSTKKRKHSFSILKAFFVRHSSEYETSDNDRKVKRNI